jgi:hypothetical protein
MGIVSKITEAVIYESPDGGETIYVRENGSNQRQLHSQSPRAIDLHEKILEDKLWGEIRRAARSNPTLKRALDEAILIYQLSK